MKNKKINLSHRNGVVLISSLFIGTAIVVGANVGMYVGLQSNNKIKADNLESISNFINTYEQSLILKNNEIILKTNDIGSNITSVGIDEENINQYTNDLPTNSNGIEISYIIAHKNYSKGEIKINVKFSKNNEKIWKQYNLIGFKGSSFIVVEELIKEYENKLIAKNGSTILKANIKGMGTSPDELTLSNINQYTDDVPANLIQNNDVNVQIENISDIDLLNGKCKISILFSKEEDSIKKEYQVINFGKDKKNYQLGKLLGKDGIFRRVDLEDKTNFAISDHNLFHNNWSSITTSPISVMPHKELLNLLFDNKIDLNNVTNIPGDIKAIRFSIDIIDDEDYYNVFGLNKKESLKDHQNADQIGSIKIFFEMKGSEYLNDYNNISNKPHARYMLTYKMQIVNKNGSTSQEQKIWEKPYILANHINQVNTSKFINLDLDDWVNQDPVENWKKLINSK